MRNDDNMTTRVQIRRASEGKYVNVEYFIGGNVTFI